MSSWGCRSLKFLLLFFVVPTVHTRTAQSQAPNPGSDATAIKSEVRMVLVDVLVTQGSKPVGGLHKEDLKVSEDGKLQTISFFEEHAGGGISPVVLPPEPPDTYTNYPTIKTTDSINVLLLDSLNTQAVDQTYLLPQMMKYLRSTLAAPTGARLAIFTLGQKLRMVCGFTADSSANLAALIDPTSGVKPKFEPQLASPNRRVSEDIACARIRSPAGQAACRDFMSEERAERTHDRIGMTLQAFQALARYLSQFPGRKNVMWVSGSFPISFFPETSPRRDLQREEYRSDIRRTADLLTADQVAVYPISARALTGMETTHPDALGRPVDEESAGREFDQVAMETLAHDTGGRAFYNTNDLSDAVAEAINSGSHYYSLAYTPTDTTTDGKYRRIELKATNRSYKLNYRRGYYAENPQTEQASDHTAARNPLLPLMSFGMPDFTAILYKVRVAPLKGAANADPKKSVVRYSADFAVSPRDLKLETNPGGVRSGDIQIAIIAHDYDGKVLNAVGSEVPIHIPPDLFPSIQRLGIQLHEQIDLPIGDVYLETGIYDLGASQAGTLGIPLRVVAIPAATR
jgi:VWFA-related protein